MNMTNSTVSDSVVLVSDKFKMITTVGVLCQVDKNCPEVMC